MNKRYMDFVPKDKKALSRAHPATVVNPMQPAVATSSVRSTAPMQPAAPKPRSASPQHLVSKRRAASPQPAAPKPHSASPQPIVLKRPVAPRQHPASAAPAVRIASASTAPASHPVKRRIQPQPQSRPQLQPHPQPRSHPQSQLQPQPRPQSQPQPQLHSLPPASALLNDPDERPVSEFADLEALAREIEEVTRGGAIVEEKTQFVAAEASFSLRQQPQLGVIEDFQPKFVHTEVEKRPLSGQPAPAPSFSSASSSASAKPHKARISVLGKPMRKTTEPAAATSAAAASPTTINVSASATPSTPAAPSAPPLNPQFINQNKVPKRPLSSTIYAGDAIFNSPKAKRASSASPASASAAIASPSRLARSTTSARPTVSARSAAPIQSAGPAQSAQSQSAAKTTKTTKPAQTPKPAKRKKGGKAGMVIAIIATIILGAAVGTVAFLLLPH